MTLFTIPAAVVHDVGKEESCTNKRLSHYSHFPIKFPQARISSHRSSLLTLLSGQKTSDEGPRYKYLNASTVHFNLLSFTLPKEAVLFGSRAGLLGTLLTSGLLYCICLPECRLYPRLYSTLGPSMFSSDNL